MNDINSLPPVSQSAIDAMNREAERKFGAVEEKVQPHINPMLQNHEEPVYYDQTEPTEQPVKEDSEPETPSSWTRPEEETDTARNMRALREKSKQAERERDEALRLVKELAAAREYQRAPVAPEPEEVDTFGINPDDLVEGKHLSKVAHDMKKLREELKHYKQQTYQQTTETKLKLQYPDIEKVLTKDNIETFQYAYPELASTIATAPDDYTRAVSAYTMLKKFGVYQEPGTTPEKETTKKNLAKPRPMASVAPQHGDSPISRANAFANGLTTDLQKQMWKEMKEAMKGS